ncbi:hypothetical protein KFE98_16960 [bacterium SCSIO 12741]|nr:hypothetical protein KFE98_16960 [bacterium SCSIO 12741]
MISTKLTTHLNAQLSLVLVLVLTLFSSCQSGPSEEQKQAAEEYYSQIHEIRENRPNRLI